MIYARLYAGMGNQMFQYAFVRKLQEIYKQDVLLDVSAGTNFGSKDSNANGLFILDKFNVSKNRITYCYDKKEFLAQAGWKMKWAICMDMLPRAIRKVTRSSRLFKLLERKLQEIFNPIGFFTSFDCYCEPIINKKNKNIYVSGMFTCEKYFSEVRNELKSEFMPICPINEKNKKFLNMILDKESVCVHIRKGDYAGNSSLDICTIEYFINAINKMKNHLAQKEYYFFVFSNDLQWCKEKLNEIDNIIYVDANDGAHPVEELRLMMSCKHFILSNSTMSWWAQYLSINEKKIVVSPSKWSKGKIEQLTDLIHDKWLLIEV